MLSARALEKKAMDEESKATVDMMRNLWEAIDFTKHRLRELEDQFWAVAKIPETLAPI